MLPTHQNLLEFSRINGGTRSRWSMIVKELDDMKKRLKDIEEEAATLHKMQAKVEKNGYFPHESGWICHSFLLLMLFEVAFGARVFFPMVYRGGGFGRGGVGRFVNEERKSNNTLMSFLSKNMNSG